MYRHFFDILKFVYLGKVCVFIIISLDSGISVDVKRLTQPEVLMHAALTATVVVIG